MRHISIVAAIALTAFAAAPAFAGEEETTTQTIRVADLDLGSAAGQALLRYRIGRAVEGACGSYSSATGPAAEDRITACRAEVTTGIHRQVARLRNAPIQTASVAR